MPKFGYISWAPLFQGGSLAATSEDLGWDIRYFGDNSCIAPDTFGELYDAARATATIRIASGATNLSLRDPVLIASSMARLQLMSAGRAVCGIGRGDSAVGMVGKAPQRGSDFEAGLAQLRMYLHRRPQIRGDFSSELLWLSGADAYEPVPLEIMCSGPRSLEIAARHADRITLGVGADPSRVRWALDLIDQALRAAGRSRDHIEVGGFVQVCLDDNLDRARDRLRVRVKGSVHMASFRGHDLDQQPDILRRVTTIMRDAYDYRHHNLREDNPLNKLIDDELVDWFAIAGGADRVRARFHALQREGLTYFAMGALSDTEMRRLPKEVFASLK